MKQIAVVIPTFEEGEYLAKTLQSFEKQTFRDFNVYIADYDPNGTRETRTIAEQHNAIVVPIHQKGIGWARHIGITTSPEPIIINFDADTTFRENNAIETLVGSLNNDNILLHCYNEFREGEEHPILWQEAAHQLLNLSRFVIPFVFGAGSTIKREHYEAVGGFKDISRWEDVQLGISVTAMYPGKVFLVPGITVESSTRRVTTFFDGNYNNAYRNGKIIKI